MKKIEKLIPQNFSINWKDSDLPVLAYKINEIIDVINKPVTTTNEHPKYDQCTACGVTTTRIRLRGNQEEFICIDCSH